MKEIFQRRKFNSLSKKMLKHNKYTKEWYSAKNQLIEYCEKFKHIKFTTGSENYASGVGDIIFDGEVPENKRGHLQIFRKKRIIVLCIGRPERWKREIMAFLTT
tara:strand:- start:255 stop:566 length:312 start_codon:yes stop_codon:yes gene_type:complete